MTNNDFDFPFEEEDNGWTIQGLDREANGIPKDGEDIIGDDIDLEGLSLGFVMKVGKELDGFYEYELIFTDDIEHFWGDGFENKPCSIVHDMEPSAKYITRVDKIKMKIKLDLIQNSNVFGFSDCTDGVIALAWENMDDYEVYPEYGRLVFMFGEKRESVERKLAAVHVLLDYKNEK